MKNSMVVLVMLCVVLLSLSSVSLGGGKTAPQGVIKLDSIKNIYKPVLFDHGKHASIAGDCGKCHHQHGNNSSLSCKECHAMKAESFRSTIRENFMACKNCHGVYDPAVPTLPGLKVSYHRQCFQCHRGMGEVGVSPKGCTVICHDKRDLKTSAKADKKD